MKWETLKDAYDGIERFLLDGPQPLAMIMRHAAKHGMSMGCIRFVHALRDAGRVELDGANRGHYKLTAWNRAELLSDIPAAHPETSSQNPPTTKKTKS